MQSLTAPSPLTTPCAAAPEAALTEALALSPEERHLQLTDAARTAKQHDEERRRQRKKEKHRLSRYARRWREDGC